LLNAKYGITIVVLLAISSISIWYCLNLSNEVSKLRSQNEELLEKIKALQRTVDELKSENERLSNYLDEVSVSIDLLVKFGNGTKRWYNNTLLPIGFTLLNATCKMLQPVKYTVYSFGVFVDEILGIENKKPFYWLWWKYENGWKMGETGADAEILKDGGIYAWVYTDTSKPPSPP